MTPAIHFSVRGKAKRGIAPAVQRKLCRLLARAMVAARCADQEISLTLTNDAEIRALNRRFANEDHSTDVLSFSQRESGGPPTPLLGDIVISLETARRQAKTQKRPLLDELFHLAVHGLAHLQGLDHRTSRQEKKMFAYEARLRTAFTQPQPGHVRK